jgi:cell shape-determining protein MreC
MKKEYYFIVALLLFAGVVFGFGSKAGLALQTALRGSVTLPGNSDLTASIDLVTLSRRAGSTFIAPVYSQYPLNLKNQLSIAAGTAEGIREGDIALSNGYLVGIVEKTFENSALVQTIFDKRFQEPVRVGTAGADALLRGGSDPELTLIPMDAAVSEGDKVYAAASGMPYGTPLGALRGLHDAGDKVFRSATLSVPYNIASLKELTITPSSGQ